MTLTFSEMCSTVNEASHGTQGTTGHFPAVDRVVISSSHKGVHLLNDNMPRPWSASYVLHYVCYFWTRKFKVQSSDEFCISGSSKGIPHPHVLSDVIKHTLVICKLAESPTAFKQHRWESSHASVMFWKYRIKHSLHNTYFDDFKA